MRREIVDEIISASCRWSRSSKEDLVSVLAPSIGEFIWLMQSVSLAVEGQMETMEDGCEVNAEAEEKI